ncbi:MAG: hypothetical protein AM325_011285 [Candidatus Thorarchaeota archaeon SMTZ1-45]|nr:MAG: hypothetical protein AM325_12975 [Candidatus Thorarchaeota archaeon SMTZ1-45]
MWNLVEDESVHLILRRPALLELARRHDSHLLDYCENLLASEDYEKWLMGLDILVALGTHDAVDRLILVYAQSLKDERKHVLSMVARILTAEHVKPFSIMVRDVACPGELDVSGWTKTAISTLQDVCKRFGIETYGEYGVTFNASTVKPLEAIDADDMSATNDRQ